MNFSEVNELNVLKKEKFLFIKFCKLLDFPGFLPKNFPGFFSFQPEIKRGGHVRKYGDFMNPKCDRKHVFWYFQAICTDLHRFCIGSAHTNIPQN